ncbi:39005_t:CDS:2, partial [Gigaspora margarita]
DIPAIRYMRQLQYAMTPTGGEGKRPKVEEENTAQKKKLLHW